MNFELDMVIVIPTGSYPITSAVPGINVVMLGDLSGNLFVLDLESVCVFYFFLSWESQK